MARVLIVEDEERIASFVAKGLRADGHLTTVVADGREGLDHAMSGEFDLMVLDIGLPSLDGFDVLDQLRSQGSRLPVIVLTARDSVTDTVTDEKGNSYYVVRVRTDRSTVGDKNLPIIPGMVAEVHVLTGKRTVLQYLLKPVLRAKANAFTER